MDALEEKQKFDRAVRLHVYDFLVKEGQAPTTAETAAALDASTAKADAAYHRLADAHMLVLTPVASDIRMVNPLSAVPTPYNVEVNGRWWWGNCIWDALGIPAMLRTDARVVMRCPDCDEPLTLSLEGGRLREPTGVIHFQVPATRWWDDIVFT